MNSGLSLPVNSAYYKSKIGEGMGQLILKTIQFFLLNVKYNRLFYDMPSSKNSNDYTAHLPHPTPPSPAWLFYMSNIIQSQS